MLKTIAAVTLSIFGLANAGVSTGKCQEVALQENFDVSQYLGLWYEQARDKLMPFEQGNCQQARYTLNTDGTLGVYNTQFNEKKGRIDGQQGTAKCEGPACKVKFFWFAPDGDYRVLATDYKNYSVVYSCSDMFGFAKTENVWILTREKELTAEVNEAVKGHLTTKVPHYTNDNFYQTKQGGECQYLP